MRPETIWLALIIGSPVLIFILLETRVIHRLRARLFGSTGEQP